MGLIGGAIFAIIGIIIGWWNGDIGALIYSVILSLSLLYCIKYNGSEWV